MEKPSFCMKKLHDALMSATNSSAAVALMIGLDRIGSAGSRMVSIPASRARRLPTATRWAGAPNRLCLHARCRHPPELCITYRLAQEDGQRTGRTRDCKETREAAHEGTHAPPN